MTEPNSKLPLSRVLVVIDPTRLMQPALVKAERAASLSGAHLHFYCCVYDDQQAEEATAQQLYVEFTREWVERLAHASRAKGYTVTTQVDWDADWRDAVARAARQNNCDLVIKPASRRRGLARQLMAMADWSLLRKCSCPTLLVNTGEAWRNNRVLAAVKLKPDDDRHVLLNQRVLDVAHTLSGALGAELHAGTVIRGEEIFFDRQQFADRCRLPRNRVHVAEGSPHRGLAEIADKISADVVIVGSAARQAADLSSIIGDTAQRLIGTVNTDIVVLPAADG
jgi:universal stress protein E